MLILTTTLAALLAATWAVWGLVREDEAQTPKRVDPTDAFCDAMDRSMIDDHCCSVCHQVAVIREIVVLYDGAELCCVRCADMLKLRRGDWSASKEAA